jgi:hypothetical protein
MGADKTLLKNLRREIIILRKKLANALEESKEIPDHFLFNISGENQQKTLKDVVIVHLSPFVNLTTTMLLFLDLDFKIETKEEKMLIEINNIVRKSYDNLEDTNLKLLKLRLKEMQKNLIDFKAMQQAEESSILEKNKIEVNIHNNFIFFIQLVHDLDDKVVKPLWLVKKMKATRLEQVNNYQEHINGETGYQPLFIKNLSKLKKKIEEKFLSDEGEKSINRIIIKIRAIRSKVNKIVNLFTKHFGLNNEEKELETHLRGVMRSWSSLAEKLTKNKIQNLKNVTVDEFIPRDGYPGGARINQQKGNHNVLRLQDGDGELTAFKLMTQQLNKLPQALLELE